MPIEEIGVRAGRGSLESKSSARSSLLSASGSEDEDGRKARSAGMTLRKLGGVGGITGFGASSSGLATPAHLSAPTSASTSPPSSDADARHRQDQTQTHERGESRDGLGRLASDGPGSLWSPPLSKPSNDRGELLPPLSIAIASSVRSNAGLPSTLELSPSSCAPVVPGIKSLSGNSFVTVSGASAFPFTTAVADARTSSPNPGWSYGSGLKGKQRDLDATLAMGFLASPLSSPLSTPLHSPDGSGRNSPHPGMRSPAIMPPAPPTATGSRSGARSLGPSPDRVSSPPLSQFRRPSVDVASLDRARDAAAAADGEDGKAHHGRKVTSREFAPSLPRRHSGVVLARTRSQLAGHPNASSAFSSAHSSRRSSRDASYLTSLGPYGGLPSSGSNSSLHARLSPDFDDGGPTLASPVSLTQSQPPSPSCRECAEWQGASAMPAPSVYPSNVPYHLPHHHAPPHQFAQVAPLSSLMPLLSRHQVLTRTDGGLTMSTTSTTTVDGSGGGGGAQESSPNRTLADGAASASREEEADVTFTLQGAAVPLRLVTHGLERFESGGDEPHPSRSDDAPDTPSEGGRRGGGGGPPGSILNRRISSPYSSLARISPLTHSNAQRSTTTTSLVLRTPTTAEWRELVRADLESRGLDADDLLDTSGAVITSSDLAAEADGLLSGGRTAEEERAVREVREAIGNMNLSFGQGSDGTDSGSGTPSGATSVSPSPLGGNTRPSSVLLLSEREGEMKRGGRMDERAGEEHRGAVSSTGVPAHGDRPRPPASEALLAVAKADLNARADSGVIAETAVTLDAASVHDLRPSRDVSKEHQAGSRAHSGERVKHHIDRKTAVATIAADYPLLPDGQTRSITDFIIEEDVGKGAYGLVKKARLRGKDGKPVGQKVIIKFIIKSRILADCWRRHRILGPIPIEIHVMDQLRRLPYVPPAKVPPWSSARIRHGVTSTSDPAASEDVYSRGQVGHPNVCKMLDFFEDREFYYLVMPCFGVGQDLFDYVESAPDGLSPQDARSLFGQIADAIRFLHANSIVHRDVKDENCILDGHGNLQLIDFGSAAHVRPGRLFDTFSGTLDYAAAEILRGEKYGGKEQDVWALGVVGYVLLCGECPFWNGEEAILGLAPGSRAEQSLRDRCVELPKSPALTPEDRERADMGDEDGGGRLEDAMDLVQRCLEVEPSDRPTAEEVCEHRFLVGRHGWTGPKGWLKVNDQGDVSKAER